MSNSVAPSSSAQASTASVSNNPPSGVIEELPEYDEEYGYDEEPYDDEEVDEEAGQPNYGAGTSVPPTPPFHPGNSHSRALPLRGSVHVPVQAPERHGPQESDTKTLRDTIDKEESILHELNTKVQKLRSFRDAILKEKDAFDSTDVKYVTDVVQQYEISLHAQSNKVVDLKKRLESLLNAITLMQKRIQRRQDVIEKTDAHLHLMADCPELCEFLAQRQAEFTRAYENGIQRASKLVHQESITPQ